MPARHNDGGTGRREFLRYTGGAALVTGVVATAPVAASPGGGSPRLELVGHSTLGARDGANTHGGVSEAQDLAAVGSFVFGNNELRIVDISDRTDPELISTIPTDPDGHSTDIRNVDIHPTNPLVFTANEGGEDAGWAIVDVDDPENPVLFGPFTVEGGNGVHNVQTFRDKYLITLGHDRGVVVYDVSDPDRPEEVSSFEEIHTHAAHIRGEFAYVAATGNGLYVLDMSDPAAPEVVATFDYEEETADVPLRFAHHAVPHPSKDIVLLGEEVGGGHPGYKHVIDVDLDSGETELLSSFQFPQHANQPTSRQGFWWTGHFSDWGVGDQEDVLFSGDYKAGVQVFDLSDPEDPVRIDQYLPTEGVGAVRKADPARLGLVDNVPFTWGAESSLAGDSGRVYVSDATTGFYVLELVGY